jgi:hypothetical protein
MAKKTKEDKSEENKTLADVRQALKDVNTRAAERKAERDAARAIATEARRKRMSSKPMSKGSAIQGLQGLNTSLGGKIVK